LPGKVTLKRRPHESSLAAARRDYGYMAKQASE
jgi:hypothetical protein